MSILWGKTVWCDAYVSASSSGHCELVERLRFQSCFFFHKCFLSSKQCLQWRRSASRFSKHSLLPNNRMQANVSTQTFVRNLSANVLIAIGCNLCLFSAADFIRTAKHISVILVHCTKTMLKRDFLHLFTSIS